MKIKLFGMNSVLFGMKLNYYLLFILTPTQNIVTQKKNQKNLFLV